MYPEELIKPMREELTKIGFKELKTAAEVDDILSNQEGTTFVIEPDSTELVILAQNELGEATNSTPAISEGEIFLRTHEHLYCVAEAR